MADVFTSHFRFSFLTNSLRVPSKYLHIKYRAAYCPAACIFVPGISRNGLFFFFFCQRKKIIGEKKCRVSWVTDNFFFLEGGGGCVPNLRKSWTFNFKLVLTWTMSMHITDFWGVYFECPCVTRG